MATDKLWGGRFSGDTDATVEVFTASEHVDRRLAEYDIAGSRAHALMLKACGIISEADCHAIIDGLDTIAQEIADDRFAWSAALEDVHMNIEARLTEIAGEPGKKLHTARSRNDQVATDMRLFTRDAIDHLQADLTALQHALIDLAEAEAESVMPGMTHMQSAQPVTCGHHLLAWNAMLERDWQRFGDCRKRVNLSPLGVAALAGTGFPVDRNMTAGALGFEGVCSNSLDAVSDRDFILEFCGAVALMMVHLSRMAEELVLWASQHFGFVDLGDAFCTGSSIMPQKKNPDVAELVRGRSGRAVGNLTSLLVLMKGQPLAYNRDNQEDKQPLFDSFDNAHACLGVLAAMVPNMTFDRERMRNAASRGHATATDLADYIVKELNFPFRKAYEITSKIVNYAENKNKKLHELKYDELKKIEPKLKEDVLKVFDVKNSVNSKKSYGGTSFANIKKMISKYKRN